MCFYCCVDWRSYVQTSTVECVILNVLLTGGVAFEMCSVEYVFVRFCGLAELRPKCVPWNAFVLRFVVG